MIINGALFAKLVVLMFFFQSVFDQYAGPDYDLTLWNTALATSMNEVGGGTDDFMMP